MYRATVELVVLILVVVFVLGPALLLHQATQEGRSRNLSAFRRALEDGRGPTDVPLIGGLSSCWVEGRLDGAPVSLRFERRGSGKQARDVAIYEVEVANPAASFALSKAGFLDHFARWIGLTAPTDLHPDVDEDHVLSAGSTSAVKALLQQDALARTIRGLTHEQGFEEVRLAAGTLRVERDVGHDALEPRNLRRVFDELIAVARQCERRPVAAPLGALNVTPRFAWTGGGAAARCPYCRDEVATDRGDDDLAACDRCGTLHHRACLDEAGACTIFGCGAPPGRSPRAPDRSPGVR